MLFEPHLSFAFNRLSDFASHAAKQYAEKRNYDFGIGNHANVSMLSPYLRHKVLKESEVLNMVLERNDQTQMVKFSDEILWRTYWKGWLEMRPDVWFHYLDSLKTLNLVLTQDSSINRSYHSACNGVTGIECFDYWVNELRSTGYLHNHARMWFASIWIFSLNLPWELGADLFYRHLFDGDPASNTLSWRWVAGIHTEGKHYVASESNIIKFCPNRFTKKFHLSDKPIPIIENHSYAVKNDLDSYQSSFPANDFCLLITEENLKPALMGSIPKVIVALSPQSTQRIYPRSSYVEDFVATLLTEMAEEQSRKFKVPLFKISSAQELRIIALNFGCNQVYTPFCPVGTSKSLLTIFRSELRDSDLFIIEVIETWESKLYHYARKGFFDFRKNTRLLVEEILTAN